MEQETNQPECLNCGELAQPGSEFCSDECKQELRQDKLTLIDK